MNIYDFISSKALANALQTENHEFSPLEKAYLIWQCTTNTVENCQKALQELIDTTEDFKLPFPYNNFSAFKEYVKNKIETTQILVDAFYKESIQSVYYYMPMNYDTGYSKFFFGSRECRNFKDVYNMALEHQGERFFIYKRDPNHPFGAEICCIFNKKGEMQSISLDIDATLIASQDENDPLDFNSNWSFVPFIMHLPCPYKVGDYVKPINGFGQYVVVNITSEYSTEKELKEAFIEGYDGVEANIRIEIENIEDETVLTYPFTMLEREGGND